MSESKAKDIPISSEFELPETLYVSDIDERVFKSIVIQCLSEIEGIGMADRSFIDSLLGREGVDAVKGISIEHDSEKHTISVRLEVTIKYGVPIPEKAEEIQQKVAAQLTHMTGLHVSCVHVLFRNAVKSAPPIKEQPEAK